MIFGIDDFWNSGACKRSALCVEEKHSASRAARGAKANVNPRNRSTQFLFRASSQHKEIEKYGDNKNETIESSAHPCDGGKPCFFGWRGARRFGSLYLG
jgi:hypothetical protein